MNHGCRKCRREGIKLFLKGEKCFSPKCPVTLRSYPPGQHGPSSFTKMSEYGKQLREKQKLKKIYGINETQLKNYYTKASKKSGDTSENLIRFLENRLDTLIYRSGFTESRSTARQMVSHGFFLVNGKNTHIPSYNIADRDVVKVKESKKIKSDPKKQIPTWISFDNKTKTIKFKRMPEKNEIELPFDINLVIEYYSR